MAVPAITKGRKGLVVTGSLTKAAAASAREVRPDRTRVGKSVRIVLCVAGPLALGLILGDIQVGLAVSLGGFVGFHGHVEPYPQRARLLAAMILFYVLAVMAGTLGATSDVALILVIGIFATFAAFVCQALALPAPREYMLVLVCLLTSAIPVPLADPLPLAALTFAGGVWAFVVLMSGWFHDRERPEREAVREAIQAILVLLEQAGPSRARRHDAVLAARTARRSIEFAGGPTAWLLRRLQLEAEDLLDSALWLGPAPSPGEVLDTAEHSITAQPDPRVSLRVRLREMLDATDAALPRPGFRRAPRNPDRPPLRSGLWSLRNALAPDSLVPLTAVRFGVAVGGALAIGVASGAPRPYWIALTVAAVLQGATLMTTARRAIERAAGTGAGVLIAGAVVLVNPSSAWIVVGVAVFLFLTEMTIAASYVVAVAFITPMTLLLAEVGQPGLLTDTLIGWRLVDTVIGCLLAWGASRLLWPSASRQRLDASMARALDAVADFLDHVGDDPAEVRVLRRELRVRLLNLRSITDNALGDRFTRAPQEDELWPIVAAIQQLGWRTLSRGHDTPQELRCELSRVQAQLAERGR